eukprot:5160886-Alexandrium_andersonii.AAC.1
MESWGVCDARPISECLPRAGKRPVGGRWVGRNKGVRRRPMFGVAVLPKTLRITQTPCLRLLPP